MYTPTVDSLREPNSFRDGCIPILTAGFITMFVLGVLGTQEIVPMAYGGAYALIAIGSLPVLVAILGVLRVCGSRKENTPAS